MIDTIKYNFINYNPEINLLNEIPNYFEVTGEHNYSNETVVTGNLDNLKISVRKNSVKVENSLCKWYLGDNFQTLTHNEIKLANEKLSDTLHIDIQQANVSRLDIADNYTMQHAPKIYCDYLSKLSRYKRLEQPDGLYYKTKNKELAFYDKIKEQKTKGYTIPQQFEGSNLLRYEMRFLHNLRKELKEPAVTAGILSNNKFYCKLLQSYSDMYLRIEKEKEINLNIGRIKGVKGMSNAGIALLIDNFGETKLLNQIKTDFSKGAITEKEKRGMLEKIYHLKSNGNLLIESELTKELNSKIIFQKAII